MRKAKKRNPNSENTRDFERSMCFCIQGAAWKPGVEVNVVEQTKGESRMRTKSDWWGDNGRTTLDPTGHSRNLAFTLNETEYH